MVYKPSFITPWFINLHLLHEILQMGIPIQLCEYAFYHFVNQRKN